MDGGNTSYQEVSTTTTSSSGGKTTKTVKTTKTTTTRTEYVVQQSSISKSSYSLSTSDLTVASSTELVSKGFSKSQTNLSAHPSLGIKQFGSSDYFQVEEIVEQPSVSFHRQSRLVTSADTSEFTLVTSESQSATESSTIAFSSRPRLEITDSSQTVVTVDDSSSCHTGFHTMSNTDNFVVTEVVQMPNIVRPRLPRFTTSKTLVETHSFTKEDAEKVVVELPAQTIVETTVINTSTTSEQPSSATIVEVETTPAVTEIVSVERSQSAETETIQFPTQTLETISIVEMPAVESSATIVEIVETQKPVVEVSTVETLTTTVESVKKPSVEIVEVSRPAQSEHAVTVDTCHSTIELVESTSTHQEASRISVSGRVRALSGTTHSSNDVWEVVEVTTPTRQHAANKPHPFPPVTRPRTLTSTTRNSADIYEVVDLNNMPSTYARPHYGRQNAENFYPRLSFSQSMGGVTAASASQSEFATTIAGDSTEHLWTKYHTDERIPPVPTLPKHYQLQPLEHVEDKDEESTTTPRGNSPYLSRAPSANAQHAEDPRQPPSRRPSTAVPPAAASATCWGYCRRGEKGGSQPAEVQFLSLDGMGMFNPLFRILLIALIIVILVLAMAVFLYGYLRMSKVEWTRWIIVSAVPQGSVLLITSLACKLILICIPFLMAIVAYYIACSWARQNEADAARGGAESGEKLPCGCPIRRDVAVEMEKRQEMDKEQYGLLLSLFKSATIFALWQGLKYIFKPTSSSSRQKACRQALSRPVIKTFSVLFFAILILYGMISLDLAMHHLSKTKYLPIRGLALPIPLASEKDARLYGRELKEVCVQDAMSNGTACTVGPVTLAAGGVSATANSTIDYAEGMLTLSGLSKTNAVAFTNYAQADGKIAQIALLVDASATSASLLAKNEGEESESWTAKTIGISTTCELISPHCDTASTCSATHSPPTTHLASGNPINYDECNAYSCAANGWPVYWDVGPRNTTGLFISEPLEARNEDSLYSQQTIPSQSGVARDGGFRFFASLSSYVDPSVLGADCTRTSSTTGLCIQGHDQGFVYAGDNARAWVGSYRQAVMGCSVQVLNVEYDYFDGEYTVHNSTVSPANSTVTYALSSVLYTSDARVTALGAALALMAAGKTVTSASVVSALEAGVGRVMLAMGHSAFAPSSITGLRKMLSLPATIMPAPLIAGFIALLVIFAILVIIVAAVAVLHINRGLWTEKKRVEKALQKAGTQNHDNGCST